MICNHNSSWIKRHVMTNHLWIMLVIIKQLYFHLSLDATSCWMIWLHFSSSFLSKLIVVASHSHICNLKTNCNHNTSCFFCCAKRTVTLTIWQAQKWLIWTQVANTWVSMHMIPCSDVAKIWQDSKNFVLFALICKEIWLSPLVGPPFH
jgi:hypothetical protein